MKLDFPDPFGPITTLMASNCNFSTDAKALEPFDGEVIKFLGRHTGFLTFRAGVVEPALRSRSLYVRLGDPPLPGNALVDQRSAVGSEGRDLGLDTRSQICCRSCATTSTIRRLTAALASRKLCRRSCRSLVMTVWQSPTAALRALSHGCLSYCIDYMALKLYILQREDNDRPTR